MTKYTTSPLMASDVIAPLVTFHRPYMYVYFAVAGRCNVRLARFFSREPGFVAHQSRHPVSATRLTMEGDPQPAGEPSAAAQASNAASFVLPDADDDDAEAQAAVERRMESIQVGFRNAKTAGVQSATRLMKELRQLCMMGTYEVDLIQDSLQQWQVLLYDWAFDEESQLSKDLLRLSETRDELVAVHLRLHFPDDFPFSPPLVYISQPQLISEFIFDGALCMELLVDWQPACAPRLEPGHDRARARHSSRAALAGTATSRRCSCRSRPSSRRAARASRPSPARRRRRRRRRRRKRRSRRTRTSRPSICRRGGPGEKRRAGSRFWARSPLGRSRRTCCAQPAPQHTHRRSDMRRLSIPRG